MKYSQNDEENVVKNYFNGKIGTFLDVGSNDGKTLSNTFALSLSGWRGVLVEPSLKAFSALRENYRGMKGFYFYNFALGITNDEIDFYDSGSHLNLGDHGLLSTLSEEEKRRWPSQEYEKIRVKCFRWKAFVNRLSIKSFDFISIDAEGLDLAIIKQIDLQETSCVCIEWNGKDDLRDAYNAKMAGFKIIYTSPENLIYVRG